MSFSMRNTTVLGALSALAAAHTTSPKLDAPCADVVLFMARDNDDPYHDGRIFPFVEATCGKLRAEGKTCDYIDVEFDVTLVETTPLPSYAATSSSAAPTPSATGSASSAAGKPATPTSAAGTRYPTSSVTVSPFPRPIAYGSCVLEVHVEYCYQQSAER